MIFSINENDDHGCRSNTVEKKHFYNTLNRTPWKKIDENMIHFYIIYNIFYAQIFHRLFSSHPAGFFFLLLLTLYLFVLWIWMSSNLMVLIIPWLFRRSFFIDLDNSFLLIFDLLRSSISIKKKVGR